MSAPAVPTLSSVVLDCPDPRALAAFYADLLDWPQAEGDDDWLTLTPPDGGAKVQFQRVEGYRAPEWPSQDMPQQFHLDLDVTDLQAAHERAVSLGARRLDQQVDGQERFWVYADPAGHPFCLCAC
jgi:predicted enzyme related to lactoylglutathione lyase